MKQIKDCPRCEATFGWMEKRVHYGDQYFDSNGEPSHFTEGESRGGKRKFCSECGKDITNCISDD